MRLLVVNYHYIRQQKYSGGIFPTSLETFFEQIDNLRKFYNFFSQDQLIEIIHKKRSFSQPHCIITFDDGLKEQTLVIDGLEKRNIKPIFFASTKPMRLKRALDVHKIHFVRTILSDKQVLNLLNEHFENNQSVDEAILKKQYRYDTLEAATLKYKLNFILNLNDREHFADILLHEVKKNELEFVKELYMDEKDLRQLAQLDMLGTHGDSHLPLGAVDEDVALNDVKLSIEFLATCVGEKKIKGLSYPYGGPTAVPKKTDAFKDYGLEYAFTMERGHNEITHFDNPMHLKRIDTNDIKDFIGKS